LSCASRHHKGYRARSAFKLIQLEKKFNFLSTARAVIDLCAAPGGWMQVARKYAPTSAVVIGVDLVQIQPIRGCIALQADITTAQCRALLQREMRDWKVDVVLNDGAPSMGASWLHDAYTQSELVLHALRLACEFLMPGGIFISKLFRSKDYNAMYWVLTQLFNKVESCKPVASRDVSAEMFVVCRGFLAPKKIDPRLLDPKYVFKEVNPLAPAVKLFANKKKQKPLREGYDDDIGQIVHKRACITQFVDCVSPGQFLGLFHELTFDPAAPLALDQNGRSIGAPEADVADIVPEAVRETTGNVEQVARREAQKANAQQNEAASRVAKAAASLSREAAIAFYAAHPQTPATMQAQMRDLRLLSRSDLKKMLQWRERMRTARDALVASIAEANASSSEEEEELDSEEKLERELDAELDRADARARRKLRKVRRTRAKQRVREALGIATPFNDEQQQNMDVFELAIVEKLDPEVQAVLRTGRDGYADKRAALDEERAAADDEARRIRFRLGPDTIDVDSDSASRDGIVDDMMEQMYQDYKESVRLRAAAQRSKELRNMSTHKRMLLQQEAETMIADEDRARRQATADVDAELRFGASRKRGRADGSDELGSSENDDSEERRKLDELAATPAIARASMWYDQALFDGLAPAPSSNGHIKSNDNNDNNNNSDGDGDDDDDSNDGGASYRKSKAPQLSAMELADRRRARISSGDSDSSVVSDFGSGSDDEEVDSDDDALRIGLRGAAEASKHSDLSDLFVSKEEAAAAAASESDSFDERKVVTRKSRRELEREKKRADMLGLKSDKAEDNKTFEIVPIDETESDTDSDKGGQDAQLEALAYARALVNGRRRRDELEDNAFNRRAFADTEKAPDWFVDDERAHMKVSLPLTREDLIAVRQQEIALNARPIKRLVEARMRKQRRANRRMERMKQQANAIADQTDIDDKSKMRLLEKLYRGGKAKEEKRERVYVVTTKGGKAFRSKKTAAKGRIVNVDPRMKKEKRAAKSSGKRSAKHMRARNKKRARN
jgi:AdoMet-dependent rRNA methyltransferase SPB1